MVTRDANAELKKLPIVHLNEYNVKRNRRTRITLRLQCFKRSFNHVHGISRSSNSGGHISDSSAPTHFENVLLASYSEAYSIFPSVTNPSIQSLFAICVNVPGGLDIIFTTAAPTLASTSPKIVRLSYRLIGCIFLIAALLA